MALSGKWLEVTPVSRPCIRSARRCDEAPPARRETHVRGAKFSAAG